MAQLAATRVLQGKISKEQIDAAFKNVKSNPNFKVAGARYELIHEDQYPKIKEFMRKFFITGEPFCKSSGLSTEIEVEDLFGPTYKQDMSLVLVSEESGEIIAARLMGLMNKEDKTDLDKCCTERLRKVVEGCQCAWQTNNVFETFDVEDVLHFFGLCTHPDWRQQGVAKAIFKAAISFVKDLGIENVVILGEGSSNFSKLIYEDHGFKLLNELVFAEYKKDGERVFKNTEPHTSMKVYAKVF